MRSVMRHSHHHRLTLPVLCVPSPMLPLYMRAIRIYIIHRCVRDDQPNVTVRFVCGLPFCGVALSHVHHLTKTNTLIVRG